MAFTTDGHTVERIVLLDFGTVRSQMDEFTNLGMTPQYMAPESCRDSQYDHKSEVWAVAVSVVFLYASGHPFPVQWFTPQQLRDSRVHPKEFGRNWQSLQLVSYLVSIFISTNTHFLVSVTCSIGVEVSFAQAISLAHFRCVARTLELILTALRP